MNIMIIGLAVLLALIIAFVISGIAINKHNVKKDKYDLLYYLHQHKDTMSITLMENGKETFTINPGKKFPLASTLKIIIAFNFVKCVMRNEISVMEKVKVDDLDKFYIENTDGGAHPKWKRSINHSDEVSLLEIAKGMMQFSSNACTDFLMHKIGIDTINKTVKTLQLNHDSITYLTPPVLMPGYFSDRKKEAVKKISEMNEQSYQQLSSDILAKMKADKANDLKEKTAKMLDLETQRIITKKMSSSTTRQYADLLFRLGQELLTENEKELFSEIVIGENIKEDQESYFWYKGGSTLYVLTSALYKEYQDHSIAVSVFIEDDTGGETYWISRIFNDFVINIATDSAFRTKVKELFG